MQGPYSCTVVMIGVLLGLASTQVAAQSAKFPQGDNVLHYVTCTKITSSKAEYGATLAKVPDSIDFGFTDSSYYNLPCSWSGAEYGGQVESDANWVLSAPASAGNFWKLSRFSGELTIIDKNDGVNTTYACHEFTPWTKF